MSSAKQKLIELQLERQNLIAMKVKDNSIAINEMMQDNARNFIKP